MKKLQIEEGKLTGQTCSGQGDLEEDTWESLADKVSCRGDIARNTWYSVNIHDDD